MNRFAKYSWGVLAWIVMVILWGAVVRATGSGAGCGNHWPSCNGEIIPTPQRIQTVIEFIHRIMSGLGMIFVLFLLLWGLKSYPRGSHQRIGFIGSAVFIIVEALLGASLVLFDLVEANSSSMRAVAVSIHLLNTFILLGFLALNAWWASGARPISLKQPARVLLPFILGLTGVAIIGMTGAITALGDTLFPSSSLAQTFAEQSDPNAHFLVQLRIYHPIIAIFVGMFSLYLAKNVFDNSTDPIQKRFSLVLFILVLIQWSAGITNVILLAPVWMQIVHLFLADLVWISYVLLAGQTFAVRKLETT